VTHRDSRGRSKDSRERSIVDARGTHRDSRGNNFCFSLICNSCYNFFYNANEFYLLSNSNATADQPAAVHPARRRLINSPPFLRRTARTDPSQEPAVNPCIDPSQEPIESSRTDQIKNLLRVRAPNQVKNLLRIRALT
jgi:hypothetical protein